MARVIKNAQEGTSVFDMIDGDIGQIILWDGLKESYIGTIIQRYNNALVVIGKDYGSSWPDLLKSGRDTNSSREKFMVELLPKGTQIEL